MSRSLASTRFKQGTFGSVYIPAGTGHRLDFGPSSEFSTSTAGTLSFWTLRMRGTETGNRYFFSYGTDANNRISLFYNTSNEISVAQQRLASNNISSVNFPGTQKIRWNRWAHYVVTWSSSSFNVYIDASSVATVSGDKSFAFPGAPTLMLGAEYSANTCATGYYAMPRIFNRALTQDEITSLYRKDEKPSDALIAAWNLNGSLGLSEGAGVGGSLQGSAELTTAEQVFSSRSVASSRSQR